MIIELPTFTWQDLQDSLRLAPQTTVFLVRMQVLRADGVLP